jgi:translation initiation factor IF-2
MAKKRVHELAKQYNMPTAEVMKRLNAAGIAVKATASAVDEHDADAALTGKKKPSANGAKPKQPQRPQLRQPGDLGIRDLGARPPEGMKPKPKEEPEGEAGKGDGKAGDKGARRPTRSSLQGERAPGAAGGVRRVVIDSQAARRTGGPGGPGGPGGGPGGPQRRPPRRGGRRRRGTYTEPVPQDASVLQADVIKVNSGSTVKDVAEYLGVAIPEVIKKLMQLGEMATLTQTLSDDAVQVLADEFDKKIEIVHAADEVDAEPMFEDEDEDLVMRPPVVTIMGHVDHGKTSLLDAIRETEVAAGEAGGITQHIGAYQVHHGEKVITFLDTPGHEAFTAMRARGAEVTDIVVLVVAADDGVKPQTREAVDHAKAAEVPILVAVNKIDKEGAQPDRVRTEMTQLGLQPEEWGGETMFVDVSAKAKTNLEDLLESIILLAEVEELKANPDTEASGVVIEAKLDPGRGAVVTVLVNRGRLKVGDALVAGAHWGRVRALHDYKGRKVKEATPSEPVEVLGFDTVPEAGEYVRVVENDRKARQLAGERGFRLKSEAQARRSQRTRSLATIFEDARGGVLQELNLVLKADVSGSLEAFADEIAKLPQSEVQVQVVLSGVGGITESDIMLAAASDAVVLGFNVRPVGEAAQVADREGVEIRTYSVIYRAIDELRDAMQGMLAPEEIEETVGTVEVRAIFRASKVGTIAGCYVTDGKITRGAKSRLVRDGTIVYDGEIESLRRVQDDVREVAAGFECGIVLRNFADVKEGDVIEVYDTRQVERTLT